MSTCDVAQGVSRFIRIRDGRSLHVQEWGETGPACVLLHGFGEGAYLWEEVATCLARRYHVYAVDLCGHGESDWLPTGAYSTAEHVADIEALLASLRIVRAVVVGHSLGAAIAVQLAARAPQLIFRMLIVDFGLSMSEETSVHTRGLFVQHCRRYDSPAEYAKQLAESRPMADAAVLERLATRALRRLPDGQYELKCDPRLAADERDGPNDLERQLRSIRCPTLLIRGAASAALSQSAAVETCARLPVGRLVIVPNAGHAVVTDNPAGFELVVRSFLLGHTGDGARPIA